jgi:hypothetical protein
MPETCGGRRSKRKSKAQTRRSRTKRSRTRRSRTRRGGAAFPSYGGPVLGQGGQPAGAVFTGTSVAGKEAVVVGGRRRMRGGTGGEGVGVGFRGEIGGTRWPIAERSPAPTTTHV